MSKPGWTRSYRSKWEHPIFRNKQEAAVWAWMCDAAQWEDEDIHTKFGSIHLKRGELLIAERTVAEDFGLTRDATRNLMKRMTDDGMISAIRDRCASRAGTIVKIVKYEEYQTISRHVFQPQSLPQTRPQNPEIPTANQTEKVFEFHEVSEDSLGGGNRKTTTSPTANPTANPTKNNEYKEVNEGRKEEVIGLPLPEPEPVTAAVVVPITAQPNPKTGARLDPDWHLPMAWGQWAMAEGLDEDQVRFQADMFRDYWIAKPGKDGRKADWQATWRNWVRKSLNDGGHHGRRGFAERVERNGFAILNRAIEERRVRSAGIDAGRW